MQALKIASYNIHKGFSHFNRRFVLHELRERVRELGADIVFLQEVQGGHKHHVHRFHNYPEGSQHEFIADQVWSHHAYGKNSVYEAGHHGNAILSRFPITQSKNTDVSAHRFEQRGLLYSKIELSGESVHCLCVHFGLFSKWRNRQLRALIEFVNEFVPKDALLVIAGDFNDWRNQLSRTLASELDVHDAFHLKGGRPARSYPSNLPLFQLDRIYVRGFSVSHSEVHFGRAWNRLSDHAALSTYLKWL
ncbi:MAG: endonuclease/exonuclease/phosphatase family protein [Gallionella sp.]